jgi:protein O-GlcNAc transferase
VQSICNLAILREGEGDRAAARALYDRALAVDDACYPARLNRAALRLQQGDAEGALADLDVLARREDCGVEVQVSRARALFALFRDADALAAAEEALRREPQNERARLDRGIALAALGRIEQAASALAQAAGARNEPRLAPAAIRLSRLLLRQSVCDWTERDAMMVELRAALSDPARAPALAEPGLVQSALGLPLSRREQRNLAEIAFAPARAEGARIAAAAPPLTAGTRGARLRVGFFAAGLRTHPESFLIRRIFTDRDRARAEYVLYALNPDDGSPLRAEIARAADRFVDASGWESGKTVRVARDDRLDVAVDLSSGYTYGRPELFAARVAPAQVGYLATATTLGQGLHDYRLSDAWATPADAQADWAERLVAVTPTSFAYDDTLAASHRGARSDHGLPAGIVLACMHQAFKIEPDCYAAWMRLLHRIPGAVLWLLDPGTVAKANLRREAQARGIAPDRLLFAPPVPLAQHLGRLVHADLFLDTFHCNAHTSTLDALWAGVPVLTRSGATMASRLAGTFLLAAGLPELVSETTAAYEAEALRLATDRAALGALKARVLQARIASPLFDTRARVRAVEDALLALAPP